MTELLYETPGNPIPDRAIAGFFAARDGKKLRYARFAATARPLKGTVVLLPGRNECIEKYFETIRDVAATGLAVAIFDWRGQGGSDRLIRDPARGYVGSFFDYTRDLEQFFEEIVLPDCRGPYFILAHSTGALVALLAAPTMLNRVRRMVLAATFLKLIDTRVSMTTFRRLATALCYTGLGRRYVSGQRAGEAPPFATNKVTSDLARYTRNIEIYQVCPQLGLGGPTVAWVRAAFEAAAIVQDPDFIARIQIPTLFIAAGADEVVSTPAIEDYARRLRSGSLLTIDGAKHEILQETDYFREQFLAAFNAYVPGTDTGGL